MKRSARPHRSNGLRRAISAAIELAERAVRHRGSAAGFPTAVASEVLTSMELRHVVVRPLTGGGSIPIDDLVGEMAILDYEDGFTFSPILSENEEFMTPEEGHCVALPGSNCPVDLATATTPSSAPPTTRGRVPETAIHRLSAWARFMAPAFNTGLVWLGGYRRHDGSFDTEATVVFKKDSLQQADLAARQWKQESYWTIHRDGGGKLTELDNTPPDSVFKTLYG